MIDTPGEVNAGICEKRVINIFDIGAISFLNEYNIETKLEASLHNSPPLLPTGLGWVMGGNFDLPSNSNISKTLRVYGVFASTF